MMRPLLLLSLVLASQAVGSELLNPTTAANKAPPSGSGLSKTLDAHTSMEIVGPVTVIVGYHTAVTVRDETYLPIQIGIGIHGRKSPSLTIARSSFALIDAEGSVHPLLPAKALDPGAVSDHKKLGESQWVRERTRSPPNGVNKNQGYPTVGVGAAHQLNTGNKFAGLSPMRVNFYPVGGVSDGTQSVELKPRRWMRDTFYFERPEGGLDGVLTIQFVARGLERPARVRFQLRR